MNGFYYFKHMGVFRISTEPIKALKVRKKPTSNLMPWHVFSLKIQLINKNLNKHMYGFTQIVQFWSVVLSTVPIKVQNDIKFVAALNRFVAGLNRFVAGHNRFVAGHNRFVDNRFVAGHNRFRKIPAILTNMNAA